MPSAITAHLYNKGLCLAATPWAPSKPSAPSLLRAPIPASAPCRAPHQLARRVTCLTGRQKNCEHMLSPLSMLTLNEGDHTKHFSPSTTITYTFHDDPVHFKNTHHSTQLNHLWNTASHFINHIISLSHTVTRRALLAELHKKVFRYHINSHRSLLGQPVTGSSLEVLVLHRG